MRVFRPSFKESGGAKRPSPRYWLEWRDLSGGVHRWSIATDRRVVEVFARRLETLLDGLRTGDVSDDSRLWFASLPDRLRQKLAETGVNLLADDTLEPLIELYCDSLTDAEYTPRHVAEVRSRLRRFAQVYERLDDFNAENALAFLAQRRRGKKPVSTATRNHFSNSLKSFGNWLVRHGRLRTNPMAGLRKLPEQMDRRHDRAALSIEECGKLLDIVRHEPERYWLYRLALETGLRASELRALRVGDVSFSGAPHLTVRAAYSRKRKRTDEMPLRQETADRLQAWITGRCALATAPLLRVPFRTADMLAEDLKAAGIDVQTPDGRFRDFHALRHTFITNISEVAESFAVVQTLARHSTPTLTARYTHTRLASLRKAIEHLPNKEAVALPKTLRGAGRGAS